MVFPQTIPGMSQTSMKITVLSLLTDSVDDTAIVPLTLMTRTQTFVFTIRPKTQYVDGHEMNAIFTIEMDYFENWN